MFRQRTPDEYDTHAGTGVRQLFTLGQYHFRDTLSDEGGLHHFVEDAGSEDESAYFELDTPTMYEFMARYLAGLYEVEEYSLDESPGHVDLLDVLEIATARARSGENDFTWEEFDPADTEVLEDDAE